MKLSRPRLLWVAATLLFGAVAVVAYLKVAPLLHPELSEIAPLDPGCDLRAGPCRSQLPGGGSVSFELLPSSLPLLKTLQIEVEVAGVEVRDAAVDFTGIDMNMGFNRPQLTASGDHRFIGTTVLPVCVRDAMEWEATVLIDSERGLLAAPFRFITVK